MGIGLTKWRHERDAIKMPDKKDDNRLSSLPIADRHRQQARPGSFYSTIRNATILLKLHGLFPFENPRSDDGRSLSFKWFSWNALWGFCLYSAISIVLYRLSFNKNANRMLLYGYIGQACIYYTGYAFNSRKLLDLLTAMEFINDKFVALNEKLPTEFTARVTFWIFFEIIAVTSHYGIEGSYALMTKRNETTPLFALKVALISLVSLLETYLAVLYLLIGSTMLKHYKRLYRRLQAAVQDKQNTEEMCQHFEYLRILHSDLADASDLLQDWLCPSFICLSGMLIAKTLIKVYQILFINGRLSVINDFLLLLLRFGYHFILTSVSNNLVNSHFQMCSIVRNTSTVGLSSEVQFQFRLAVLQTTVMPINTKALGLFTMTRPLLPCILSVVVIYVMVVIQLEAPLQSFAKMLKNSDGNLTR